MSTAEVLALVFVGLLTIALLISMGVSGVDEPRKHTVHSDTHSHYEELDVPSGKCRKNRTRRLSRQRNVNGAWRQK
jgi:hypothetical protein